VGAVHHINRVALTVRRTLPVFPYQQTSAALVGMSVSGHEQTSSALFDHLVGGRQQRTLRRRTEVG
jgi:hypothetical protein